MDDKTSSLLKALDIRPSKKLGQNFMLNPEIAVTIANFALPQPVENLLEIGGGLGMLTGYLLDKCEQLTVVEFDKRLAEYLTECFRDNNKVRVVQADIIEYEIDSNFTIVGNVPYSISSEILFWLIKWREQIQSATLLMQLEFVERLAARVNTKAYGILSVQIQLFADIRVGSTISGTCFMPKADVDSKVVKLTFLSEPRFPIKSVQHFQQVVRAAFSQRRKTLLNSLHGSGIFNVGKPELAVELEKLNINPERRAESLSVEEFAQLSYLL